MAIKTNKVIPWWEYLLIVACMLYYIIPGSNFFFPFYYVLFIQLAYSMYLLINRYVDTKAYLRMFVLIIVLALLYALLTDPSSIGQDVSDRELKRFVSKLMQYSCMFFPIVLFKRCKQYGSRKRNIILVIVAIVAMCLVCYSVLELIKVNPMAARDFGYEERNKHIENFVVAYPFVYGMTFMFVATFIAAKNLYRRYLKLKLILILLCLFFLYFLYKAQFTLAILTSFITIVFVIIRDMRSVGARVFGVMLIILFLLIFPYVLESLIIPNLPEMLADRFGEILDFFNGNSEQSSDLKGRLILYKKTILAFFSSPIVGNRSLPFDGHATYLTIWADLGIIGGSVLVALLVRANRLMRRYQGAMYVFFAPLMVHLLLNGFTNPIQAALPIYICLWFVIPLAISILSDKFKSNSDVHNG